MFKNLKLIQKVIFLACVIIIINLVLQGNFILKMRNTDILTAKQSALSEANLQAKKYETEFKRIEELISGYSNEFSILIERGELSRESAISILEKSLEEIGLKKFIPEMGTKFNPSQHEALSTVDGDIPGVIYDVILPGYILDDIVIRPSKVVVTKDKR